MAKKFFVKNESPVVEKTIYSFDGNDSCIVAFPRYTRKEIAKMFEEYHNIPQDEYFVDTLIAFVSSRIKYLKDVSLTSFDVDENGNAIEGTDLVTLIADTRTSTNEAWNSPEACKELVLETLFSSFSWGSEIFIKAFNDYIQELTSTGQEVETKN